MKRIAIICALVYLIIAIAADFFAIGVRSSRQSTEIERFYLIEGKLEQIAQEKGSSKELREAVTNLRALNEGVALWTGFAMISVSISIGAALVSLGALIYHWKKNCDCREERHAPLVFKI